MFNIGIIGLGRMGIVHAENISKIKDFKLVAISEKNTDRIEEIKNKYKVKVFADNDELLQMKEIDFVVVSTTNETHEDITIKALCKGKNVIVEKPMAINYESALRMVKSAEINGKNIFVHHSMSWDRDFLFIKDIFKSGKLGKILIIQNNYGEFDENWIGGGIQGMKNPWRSIPRYGGGMLLDMGPHLLDQTLLLTGKDPVGVFGFLQRGIWSKDVEDHVLAILKFDDNLLCQIEISNNCRISLTRWHIIGTKGTLRVTGSRDIYDKIELNYVKDNGEKEIQKIELLEYTIAATSSGFYEDLAKFLKGDINEFPSMYQACKIIKIMDLIRKSSEENNFICFDKII